MWLRTIPTYITNPIPPPTLQCRRRTDSRCSHSQRPLSSRTHCLLRLYTPTRTRRYPGFYWSVRLLLDGPSCDKRVERPITRVCDDTAHSCPRDGDVLSADHSDVHSCCGHIHSNRVRHKRRRRVFVVVAACMTINQRSCDWLTVFANIFHSCLPRTSGYRVLCVCVGGGGGDI
jgi:hypothetical protein